VKQNSRQKALSIMCSAKMICTFCIFVALLPTGLHHAVHESFDGQTNYHYVFKDMKSPMPRILHSRLERYDRRLLGIKMSPANGEWEFEMLRLRNGLKK